MSLKNQLESIIQNFITQISEKYNINGDELFQLWTGSSDVKLDKSTKALATVNTTDLSIERLSKCNKAELVALCKSTGKKCTGTKDILVNRLLGKSEDTKPTEPKVTSEKALTKVPSKTTSKKAIPPAPVVQKIVETSETCTIRRNQFGNFSHPESKLVFSNKTSKVIGKQQDDGTVTDLTEEDIEECKKYKFEYTLPDNLDKKTGLDSVKVKELEDELEIGVEEEEADEEAEEEEDEIIDDE